MTILAYSTSSTETSGTDMNAWLAKLQEGKKSTAQLQQEMLKGSIQSVDTNKLDDIDNLSKTDEEKEEDEEKDDIQEPSTVTKEQLQSPIDLKI